MGYGEKVGWQFRSLRHAAELVGNLAAGVALSAQNLDGVACGLRCWSGDERGREERSRKPSVSTVGPALAALLIAIASCDCPLDTFTIEKRHLLERHPL